MGVFDFHIMVVVDFYGDVVKKYHALNIIVTKITSFGHDVM